MPEVERKTIMVVEDDADPITEKKTISEKEKKPRKRKTHEEQIKEIEEQKEKLLLKLEQLNSKQEILSLTPAEKKAEKRRVEDHCKIIAGVTAFELYKKGKAFFTIENFKNRLYNQLDKPLEIKFINRQLKEEEKK